MIFEKIDDVRGLVLCEYPSGNQVDGLPLVAIPNTLGKRKSRGQRTQVHLTM